MRRFARIVLSVLLSIAASISFAACGENGDGNASNNGTQEELSFRIEEALRFVFDGDSVTDRHFDEQGTPSWTAVAKERMAEEFPNAEFVNAATAGYRLIDIAARWDETLAKRPDVLTVLIGYNDAWYSMNGWGEYYDRFREVYVDLIARARAQNPDLVVIILGSYAMELTEEFTDNLDAIRTIDATRPYLDRYLQKTKEAAEEMKADAFVDLDAFFRKSCEGKNPLEYSDGVHPTLAGAELIAAEFRAAVRHVFEERRRVA